jgi:HD-like signal output (HDOD) protein
MDLPTLLAQPNGLPSVPQAVARLIQTFDDDNASLDDIAECIEGDPVIVAKLLRLTNSPFFFRGRAIESVSDAVRLLGMTQVRSLVVGLIAKDRFPALPPAILEPFWRFSMTTAALARHLSNKTSADSEAAYTGALLHMIGALVMRVSMTEKMMALDRVCPPLAIGRGQAEMDALGYTYAEVGTALARQWQLPERIVRIIETQRAPRLDKEGGRDAAVVLLSSWRARAIEMKLGRDAQISLFPIAAIKAIKALNIEPVPLMEWTPDFDQSAVA